MRVFVDAQCVKHVLFVVAESGVFECREGVVVVQDFLKNKVFEGSWLFARELDVGLDLGKGILRQVDFQVLSECELATVNTTDFLEELP